MRHDPGRTAAVMAAVIATLAATATARADVTVAPAAAPPAADGTPPPERVPLLQGFSRLEIATTATVVVGGTALLAFGTSIFGSPDPSLGPPAPGSFDRRWSDRLHLDDGSGGRFLGRVPDFAGQLVLPYLPALIYGIDAAYLHATGRGRILPGDPNPDHRFLAYAEALGWTTLAVAVTKLLVGRQRPYAALDHPELAGRAAEVNLSFFSGHSAGMFAAASFVALDASRRLRAGPLAGGSPARRWFLGTALPYLGCFGAASLVALSRVIDQQHWPSDVLVGAAVGTGIAHLAYLGHFDDRGQPRRLPSAAAPAAAGARLVPLPGGAALVGYWR